MSSLACSASESLVTCRHFLKEFPLSNYLYACGQHVTFTGKRVMSPSWTGDFVITKLLPSGGEEPRYEIRRAGETHSRAALESDLTARSETVQSSDRKSVV